jgi:hypothetical protein
MDKTDPLFMAKMLPIAHVKSQANPYDEHRMSFSDLLDEKVHLFYS